MTPDVIELHLVDHRRFEELLGPTARQVRQPCRAAGRARGSRGGSGYPALRGYQGVGDALVEHGVQEHAEGHQTLLALMEVGDPHSSEWDRKLENLIKAVTHHLDVEQRTILHNAQDNGRRSAESSSVRRSSGFGRSESTPAVARSTTSGSWLARTRERIKK